MPTLGGSYKIAPVIAFVAWSSIVSGSDGISPSAVLPRKCVSNKRSMQLAPCRLWAMKRPGQSSSYVPEHVMISRRTLGHTAWTKLLHLGVGFGVHVVWHQDIALEHEYITPHSVESTGILNLSIGIQETASHPTSTLYRTRHFGGQRSTCIRMPSRPRAQEGACHRCPTDVAISYSANVASCACILLLSLNPALRIRHAIHHRRPRRSP